MIFSGKTHSRLCRFPAGFSNCQLFVKSVFLPGHFLPGFFAVQNRLAMPTTDKYKSRIKIQELRYWLFWLLFVVAVAYGVHCYIEYRNLELDKRLERLK